MFFDAPAGCAQRAQGVRVVNSQGDSIGGAQTLNRGQVGDIPLHRVNPVHHHHRGRPPGDLLQFMLKVGHVIVLELDNFTAAHQSAIINRSVAMFITTSVVSEVIRPRAGRCWLDSRW